MGYFSNSDEGDAYEDRYCVRCQHGGPDINDCAVWMAHYMHNYDECNNPNSILHLLIERDETGGNKQCQMFLPRTGK